MSIWRAIWRGTIGAAAIGFSCLAHTWLTLPDVRPLVRQNPGETAFMRLRADERAAEGEQLRHLQRWINYRRVSPALTRAVLVTEDAAFWDHDGVDFAELKNSLELNWQRGGFIRGGSTITQQLAKNLYLSPSRNPYRKVVEFLIARRLEAELPKARILELYLNVIEWGDGIWGAEAAAQAYFGVSASSLSGEQAALLAGAIINPRVYSPARPNARLRGRQRMILARMGGVKPPPAAPIVPPLEVPVTTELPVTTSELPVKPESLPPTAE